MSNMNERKYIHVRVSGGKYPVNKHIEFTFGFPGNVSRAKHQHRCCWLQETEGVAVVSMIYITDTKLQNSELVMRGLISTDNVKE